MAEILKEIQDWAGGPERALDWYRSEPIPAFGGQTAEAMVSNGNGEAVMDYIHHLSTGGYA